MAYIYSFRDGVKDKTQLGNKGANLVEMTQLGLPVPPGFTLTIEAYKEWRYARNSLWLAPSIGYRDAIIRPRIICYNSP